MSNKNGHGGTRSGSGRKPKADEIALIEKLKPYENLALNMLAKGLKENDVQCLRLYMEYRFGKAKQIFEGTIDGGVILDGIRPSENAPITNGVLNGKES